jgi:acyl-coenzyme A thioesterase PaaI-like protein
MATTTERGAGSAALRLFERHGGSAAGRWLVSKLICFKAPYFASIQPRLESLAPGRCSARIRHRRSVQNHIGTVHAIALCNLAEFCGGLATDAAMTPAIRWIPKGMSVRYLKKANGEMHAEAILDEIGDVGAGAERIANVVLRDKSGEAVFDAKIVMWVSPKK